MLIVQKYGGTSVGDCERIQNVAKRVIEAKEAGNSVVVVVSAMSGETDKLLGYTKFFSRLPNTREVDMVLSAGERVTSALLAIALEELGYKAISLSGRGAGMITDSSHTKARIESIDATRLNDLLAKDYIVVVAGFQGVTQEGNVTTLGRGGSDLSAVALAGALQADLCEIYTDVDGVYTTDPRIEPKARKIDKVSYDEMLELASMGAKVLLNRSVEMAKKYSVELEVLSSLVRESGTIVKEAVKMEKMIIRGVTKDTDVAQISVVGMKDIPGNAFKMFSKLAAKKINIDVILQSIGRDGTKDISFTCSKEYADAAVELLEEMFAAQGASITCNTSVAKISVVGTGMQTHSGTASKMFGALYEAGINIQMINTSEIRVSVLLDETDVNRAVKAIHAKFFDEI